MFPKEKGYALDLEAANRCAADVAEFAGRVANAVIVSDYLYSDAEVYDPDTEAYRACLARIDRMLAARCDTVIEFSAGQKIIHKGEFPE